LYGELPPKALSILSPKMEDIGADENMSQGSDGSFLVGYESSASEKSVFAGKMGKKVKPSKNK